jgi:hypothetical protein
MYNLDIAQLLRDALQLSGCTDQQIGQFDGHSTIELELSDLPSLNIAASEAGVWCWSYVAQFSLQSREHYASALLGFLFEGFAHARTEQMQLVFIDDTLELRVLLSEQAVSGPRELADAVDGYVERLIALREMLR